MMTATEIIEILNCHNYYNSPNAYWFIYDPTIILIIDSDDRILLKDVFSGDGISIVEIWEMLSKDQKKILIFNLDKFK